MRSSFTVDGPAQTASIDLLSFALALAAATIGSGCNIYHLFLKQR
jgi:hypothetical protein